MLDADNLINNMSIDVNSNYTEKMINYNLEETNDKIDKLSNTIDKYDKSKRLKPIDYVWIFNISMRILSYAIGDYGPIGFNILVWLSATLCFIIPKVKAYIISPILEEKKKDLERVRDRLFIKLEEYEKAKENKKEKLKDDYDYNHIKQNLLEKIEGLGIDELLAVRTVVTEYTTNKDIPSQVGNIAQFLAETQVGDVDIKDTSLYNKQVDDEVSGKARSYSIEHK